MPEQSNFISATSIGFWNKNDLMSEVEVVGEGEEGLRNENVCNGNLTFNGWTNDNKFESKKEVIESNNNFFLTFVRK